MCILGEKSYAQESLTCCVAHLSSCRAPECAFKNRNWRKRCFFFSSACMEKIKHFSHKLFMMPRLFCILCA